MSDGKPTCRIKLLVPVGPVFWYNVRVNVNFSDCVCAQRHPAQGCSKLQLRKINTFSAKLLPGKIRFGNSFLISDSHGREGRL